eukprot:sb/3472869/
MQRKIPLTLTFCGFKVVFAACLITTISTIIDQITNFIIPQTLIVVAFKDFLSGTQVKVRVDRIKTAQAHRSCSRDQLREHPAPLPAKIDQHITEAPPSLAPMTPQPKSQTPDRNNPCASITFTKYQRRGGYISAKFFECPLSSPCGVVGHTKGTSNMQF